MLVSEFAQTPNKCKMIFIIVGQAQGLKAREGIAHLLSSPVNLPSLCRYSSYMTGLGLTFSAKLTQAKIPGMQ